MVFNRGEQFFQKSRRHFKNLGAKVKNVVPRRPSVRGLCTPGCQYDCLAFRSILALSLVWNILCESRPCVHVCFLYH